MKKSEKKAEIEERKLFVGGPVVVFKWKAGEENIPVEYVSPNVKDVFGYTPEEFTSGKIVYDDIIHPDDRERVIVEAQSYRRKGVMQFEQEYRIVTADGKYKWVHDFTVIKKEKGKPTYYHGYLVDITKRKETEESLKESEEKYRMMVDSVEDYAIFMLDDKGHVVSWNKGAERIKGYKAEEIIGKHVSIFYTDEDVKGGRPEKELETAAKKGKFEGEGWRVRKDGSRFWANIVITALKDGKLRGFVKITRDLTERKKMEESLKESEERYKALFDRSLYLVYLHDFEGNFIDANDATLKLLGYKRKELPSLKFSSLIDEEQLPLALKNIEEIKKAGYTKEPSCYKLKKKDGGHIWAEAESSVVYKDGKPYAIQGIARDITKQKEAEEKLRKANRMFKVLYKSNEALIFAKNEEELLNDICNIIVKDGGYSLAWVGYTEEGKEVKVMAACGKHVDCVKKIKALGGKSEFGKGPTGTAIKTGKPCIEKDIEHGDSYIPWWEEAIKHGVKSSITLPLIANGKTIGVLSICSGEINAFDEEEVTLLSQLADDLAYGILSSRNKVERERMEKELEKEREQLLSIFEGVDEPIYVADPGTYEILYVNRTMKKEFGSDIIGKKCYEIFQNLDKPCDFCTNDKIFGKNFGKTYVWEFHNKKTGKWYRCIDRGITWYDGRKVRLEIAIDITDMVEAEEETKRALELEKQFKLEAAHYFFNPIAIAKGYLELAMEEVPEKQKEKLKAAKHAISRVEKVVKNVTQRGEIHE